MNRCISFDKTHSRDTDEEIRADRLQSRESSKTNAQPVLMYLHTR